MPQLRQVDPRKLDRQRSLDEQEKMKLEIEKSAKHKTKFDSYCVISYKLSGFYFQMHPVL